MTSPAWTQRALLDLAPIALDTARSEQLRTRILGQSSAPLAGLRAENAGAFVTLCPGIAVKKLHQSGDVMTALWRLERGAIIPEHGHRLDEQCLVLEGELEFQGKRMLRGDFLLAKTGEKQSAIKAIAPALLLIVGEARF
jgi:quercetin dioxygenase-like cupin family protein